MKKILFILFLIFVTISPLEVKALSVSNNNLTIEPSGSETIELYAEVDTEITEINFSLVYMSYDIPAYFNIESGLNDEVSGINHKIVFSAPVTGKIKLGTVSLSVVDNPKVTAGSANISSAKATTTTGETVTLDMQIINVTVNKTQDNNQEPEVNPEEDYPVVNENNNQGEEKDTKKNTNLLEKIESEIVKITIKEDVYEYKVNIKNNVEELDLKPIAKDEKYKVEITTQKISELKDNQIIITVKDGDNSEEYKIKVNILDDVEETEIDEEDFEPTYKYKGKWVTLIIILTVVLFAGLLLMKKK